MYASFRVGGVMKATYRIKNDGPRFYATVDIDLKHKDLEYGWDYFFLCTEDSKTPRGARGRVKRIMGAMGIDDVEEVK